jgi:hypothetical protein
MFRLLVAGRAALGAVLLAEPDVILDRLTRHRVGTSERTVARLLGVRNLVEGALVARQRGRGWLLAGAAVDATHALSMIALAAIRPQHRRLASASAVAATATAAAGIAAAQGAPRGAPRRER